MDPEGRPPVNSSCDTDNGLIASYADDSLGAIATSEAILDLPECERFVFVMCVLEHYSIHDCALLLGKSPREIDEVRQRVGNHVGQRDELGDNSKRFAMG
jgi:DNA-directed RNA polymerase specialized sigma24 family protein